VNVGKKKKTSVSPGVVVHNKPRCFIYH